MMIRPVAGIASAAGPGVGSGPTCVIAPCATST
jgi:hypothetical protein